MHSILLYHNSYKPDLREYSAFALKTQNQSVWYVHIYQSKCFLVSNHGIKFLSYANFQQPIWPQLGKNECDLRSCTQIFWYVSLILHQVDVPIVYTAIHYPNTYSKLYSKIHFYLVSIISSSHSKHVQSISTQISHL